MISHDIGCMQKYSTSQHSHGGGGGKLKDKRIQFDGTNSKFATEKRTLFNPF